MYTAAALQYRRTAHFAHAILALVTGGLWILPWLVIWAMNNNHNQRVDQRFFEMSRHNRCH